MVSLKFVMILSAITTVLDADPIRSSVETKHDNKLAAFISEIETNLKTNVQKVENVVNPIIEEIVDYSTGHRKHNDNNTDGISKTDFKIELIDTTEIPSKQTDQNSSSDDSLIIPEWNVKPPQDKVNQRLECKLQAARTKLMKLDRLVQIMRYILGEQDSVMFGEETAKERDQRIEDDIQAIRNAALTQLQNTESIINSFERENEAFLARQDDEGNANNHLISRIYYESDGDLTEEQLWENRRKYELLNGNDNPNPKLVEELSVELGDDNIDMMNDLRINRMMEDKGIAADPDSEFIDIVPLAQIESEKMVAYVDSIKRK